MSIEKYLRGLGLAVVAAVLVAGAAPAATLSEADMPGGAFAGSWASPTEVGAGITAVSGTGSQNSFDNFVFTGLPTGAQQITLDFTAPAGIGDSYSAGGSILYSFQPFRYGWDGATLGTVHIAPSSPSKSLVLALGDGFAGPLYLALNFTYGANLAYNIGAPSNAATVAPIPLPAGFLLIGSALAAAGLLRIRSRAA